MGVVPKAGLTSRLIPNGLGIPMRCWERERPAYSGVLLHTRIHTTPTSAGACSMQRVIQVLSCEVVTSCFGFEHLPSSCL